MANGQLRRVEAVVFDAMFTTVQPKGTRAELNARVLELVTGITADPDDLQDRILRLRRERPRDRSMRMSDYWPYINAQLLRELAPGKFNDRQALKLGREMHTRTLTDTELYTVHPEMRELLEWLRGCTTIGVASNQKHAALLAHLRAGGIERLFGGHCYSSDRIRSPKPSRSFWRAVRKGVRASSYGAVAYVGNSVENDVELALRYGAPVVLLDLDRRVSGLAIAGVHVVHDIAELRARLAHLLHRHTTDAGSLEHVCMTEVTHPQT